MEFAGVGLETAIQMAVHHPANLLGTKPGGLEPGGPADLVLFDLVDSAERPGARRFQPRATILDGELVWGSV
jgi:cytosine/adenosine deaminase-related metal-dependent hydrolase